MKTCWYVGVKTGNREAFKANAAPTQAEYGAKFSAVIGPFVTKRGAEFCAVFKNSSCTTVAEYEAAAKKYANK